MPRKTDIRPPVAVVPSAAGLEEMISLGARHVAGWATLLLTMACTGVKPTRAAPPVTAAPTADPPIATPHAASAVQAPPAASDAGGASNCPPRSALAAAAVAFVPREKTVGLWSVPLAGGAPIQLATLPRAADSPVSGTTVPGTDLVALTLTHKTERDPTWSGTLVLVAPGKAPLSLLEQVHTGGPVLATADGQLFAVRGAAGKQRTAADSSPGYRGDHLEIVAVDVASGKTRPVYSATGDALFLLGATGERLIVYQVAAAARAQPGQSSRAAAPTTNEFLFVDQSTGQTRVLLSNVPALARDFSFDAGTHTLWFTAHQPNAPEGKRWAVHALNVETGQVMLAATGESMGFSPHAWPGGKVAFRCPPAPGLCITGVAAQPDQPPRGGRPLNAAPLGDGPDDVQAIICTAEGDLAVGVHGSKGPFAQPFTWDVGPGRARIVPLPRGRVLFLGAVTTRRKP